jgi:lysophospholipase L1-like esterase
MPSGKEVELNYPDPELQLDADTEEANDLFGEIAGTLEADRRADRRFLDGKKDIDDGLSARWPVSKKIVATMTSVWLAAGVGAVLWGRYERANQKDDDAPIAAGGPMPTASVGEAKVPGATFDQQARAKELEAQQDSRSPLAQGPKTDVADFEPGKDGKPPRPIDDPSGKALDKFFAKLVRVENKEPGAIARIVYYGDSIVASDFVTGQLRRRLQTRFGDAGHGYSLIANAWPGWFHIDVARAASAEWRVSTCVGPYAKDGIYGLGCASFTGREKGTWASFGTAELDKWGRSVAHYELEYLQQPDGGRVALSVDGGPDVELSTDGEQKLAWKTIDVSDGAHKLTVKTLDDKPTRMFGVRMERDVPGVTLTACGITGARARFLDKQDDAAFAEVLRAAKPDLIVLAFGSNEVTDGTAYPMDKYRETLAAVMEQIEKAVPDASWMLAGPPDMASNKEEQGHSKPMVYFITENEKKLAGERGWAFWDQFRAMGGGGSMWSWIKAGLGSTDMFHPTGQGGTVLGNWEYQALMDAFDKYKAARRGGR